MCTIILKSFTLLFLDARTRDCAVEFFNFAKMQGVSIFSFLRHFDVSRYFNRLLNMWRSVWRTQIQLLILVTIFTVGFSFWYFLVGWYSNVAYYCHGFLCIYGECENASNAYDMQKCIKYSKYSLVVIFGIWSRPTYLLSKFHVNYFHRKILKFSQIFEINVLNLE